MRVVRGGRGNQDSGNSAGASSTAWRDENPGARRIRRCGDFGREPEAERSPGRRPYRRPAGDGVTVASGDLWAGRERQSLVVGLEHFYGVGNGAGNEPREFQL